MIRRLLESKSAWLAIILATCSSILKTRAALQLENVALRHQIGILQHGEETAQAAQGRSALVCLSLQYLDELAFGAGGRHPRNSHQLARHGLPQVLDVEVRAGKPGRPGEVRDLIRQMSRESGLGGSRIHGELLKRGINIGQTSVSKYRSHKPPSPDVEDIPRQSL